MASIIDNKNKTMLEALKNSLKQAERIDILTAFFYFSGFDALADELKEKHIRILVGNTIDPDCISRLSSIVKDEPNEALEAYGVRGFSRLNNSQKKEVYIKSFIEMFNKSSLSAEFDSTDNQKVFKMFLEKIEDGSLEIRLTAKQDHGKFYILKNKSEYSCIGVQKGVVFMGSSNLTYNGLLGQGEINERFNDDAKYDEYNKKFEDLWNESKSIDICVKNGNDDFKEEIKKKLWIFVKPSPYSIYVRILHELYSSMDSQSIATPSKITSGKFFDFKYQMDAIKYGIDCIEKNHGVIISDVVGLGKSVVASAIAYNLDCKKTIIIAPPHLVDQWNDYQQDFGLRGVKVISSGMLDKAHATYSSDPDPILFIIDEAHRYRNELTETYQYLHQLTRSNAENKVILLTATPYNNKPQDLFALIKLFQTPSRSTINSVDNLGVRFHELIAQYNKLEKEGKKNMDASTKDKLDRLSEQFRILINPVIVRRSRLDLLDIKEYAEDLKMQGIKFPEVVGPELIEYDLGTIRDAYLSTLEKISNQFLSARYNPAEYLHDPAAFNDEYGALFGEMDIVLFQGNLAKFVRRLLVMRFESSKAAFKSTLTNILQSYNNIKKWWDKGYVPIKKSGYLPDPNDDEIEEILNEINNVDVELDVNKIKKKAIPFPKELFKEEYSLAIDNDIKLLNSIFDDWFKEEKKVGFDPKYNKVKKTIDNLLLQNSSRKIVVFSSYADTVDYVAERLQEDGFKVLLYTGASSDADRHIVKKNFDASYKESEKANDFDIIVATDALSEGFNLNRAGIVINYDIPYNPTRVVQRIGRINRINRKMFDKIYTYNLFPTDIGEETTLIKGISTLKMLLINNIVGSDTKTLTQDETLQSYFKTQFKDADSESAEKSWDNTYRNDYNSIKNNSVVLSEALGIPERVRIVRKGQKESCAIAYAKRGVNSIFAVATDACFDAELVSPERLLRLFKAEISETSYEFDDNLDKKFIKLREEITKPYQKIKIDKRRATALKNLQAILDNCQREKDYIVDLVDIIKSYDDLSDGELKYLANLKFKKADIPSTIGEIKIKIPTHYINQIKQKVESIDSQTEIIMFTEDLRSDSN